MSRSLSFSVKVLTFIGETGQDYEVNQPANSVTDAIEFCLIVKNFGSKAVKNKLF